MTPIVNPSIRKQILDNIVSTFEQVTTANGWPIQFTSVNLGPLMDYDNRKRFTLGVVAQKDRYAFLLPLYERWLTVGIEFRLTVNRDDPSPGDLVEDLLAVVESVVAQNVTWGGLAIDTKLMNNEMDMYSYADKSIQGVLFIEVRYRHSITDPTNPDPKW